jgi:hypothetical protein
MSMCMNIYYSIILTDVNLPGYSKSHRSWR